MSLVSEALRKARQEQLRRQAERAGVPTLGVPATPRPLRLLPLMGLSLLAGLAGALAVFLWLGPQRQPAPALAPSASQAPSSEKAQELAPAGTTPSSSESLTGSPRDPALGGAGLAQPTNHGNTVKSPQAASQSPSSPEANPPAPNPPEQAPPAQGAPQLAPSSPPEGQGVAKEGLGQKAATPVAASSPPQGASAKTRVFLVEANLGYARLHLDYLVYRSREPFARINGQEVVEGSILEGFVVEKILEDRVLLRDQQGPLVLKVP